MITIKGSSQNRRKLNSRIVKKSEVNEDGFKTVLPCGCIEQKSLYFAWQIGITTIDQELTNLFPHFQKLRSKTISCLQLGYKIKTKCPARISSHECREVCCFTWAKF